MSADGVSFPVGDGVGHAGSAVWFWDPQRARIVWANAAALDLWGARDAPALAARPMPHLAASLKSRTAGWTCAVVLPTPIGPVAGRLAVTRLALADGHIGLRVRFCPAPARADTLALRASAFDRASAPLAIADPDGRMVARNAAFAAAFGDADASHGTLRRIRLDATEPEPGHHLVEPAARDNGAATVSTEALARIAHEFRSPLTAVLGFAEFLRETLDTTPPQKVRAYLDDMVAAAERMRRLADDIVALGASPAGHRVTQTPLDAIIAQTLRFAGPAAHARGVTLSGPEPSGLAALGDPDALGRAIVNLVDNAIRHGHPGGHVRVSIEDGVASDGAAIVIADDGPGLSAHGLAEALQPYGRPEPYGRPDAATPPRAGGLGLPIVRDFVASIGGHFDVATSPGAGLRARIVLPPARLVRQRAPVTAP